MALERKSSLRKVPAADVVEVLTSAEQAAERSDAQKTAPAETQPPMAQGEATIQPSTRRPGPGRPRGKRRMEPFSSKIEISLRDKLDAYLAETGITITDFLDEAIRDRLRR